MQKKTGKQYEALVHEIFTKLSPQATVTLDDKIMGRSGIMRSVDISIRQKCPPLNDILIIIDAKDFNKPVDQPRIAKIADDVEDIQAARGIVISTKGFTKLARQRAKIKGIELYTAHDARNKDWTAEIKIPIIWETLDFQDYSLVFQFGGGFQTSTKIPVTVPLTDHFVRNIFLHPLTTLSGNQSSVAAEFMRIFDSDERYRQPHQNHKIDLGASVVRFGDYSYIFKQLLFEFSFQKKYSILYVTPVEYQGLVEYNTKTFIPANFYIDNIPLLDKKVWRQIDDPERLSIKTNKIDLQGLDFGLVKLFRARYVK
jgi:hypothetical protein